MKISKLKNRLFLYLLLGKLVVGTSLFYYTAPGELTLKEAGALLALILPMFMMYLGTMFRELVKTQNVNSAEQEGNARAEVLIKPFNARLYQFIAILYPLIILMIIRHKVAQAENLSIEETQIYLGIAESSFSVWLGLVINSLFEKEKEGSK